MYQTSNDVIIGCLFARCMSYTTLIEPEVISYIMAKFEMTKISIYQYEYFWLFNIKIVLLSEYQTKVEKGCQMEFKWY